MRRILFAVCSIAVFLALTGDSAAQAALPASETKSAGSEIEKPLAVVMVGGLASATVFTLVVLPSVYGAVENIKDRIRNPRAAIGQEAIRLEDRGMTYGLFAC